MNFFFSDLKNLRKKVNLLTGVGSYLVICCSTKFNGDFKTFKHFTRLKRKGSTI